MGSGFGFLGRPRGLPDRPFLNRVDRCGFGTWVLRIAFVSRGVIGVEVFFQLGFCQAFFLDVLEALAGRREDGVLAGKAFPTPHDGVAIGRIELQQPCLAANLLRCNQGRARTAKAVEHDIAPH